MPARRRRRGRSSAVLSRASVAGDRCDQQTQLEPRGVEEDQDVASDWIGVHPTNAGRASDTGLEVGSIDWLTPQALNPKTGPPGHGHEDDPDGRPAPPRGL